jgi:His/Glu/Gln/Arg/opine family amino acid ABC transporter permease subunit
MDFSIIFENLHRYQEGLWITLQLTSLSVTIGLFLALILALMKNTTNPILSGFARCYIYVIRGTPLLVQLYLVYYGLSQLEIVRESFLWIFFREPYLCALFALTLNTSAYGAEIIRGAIKQTSLYEIEASYAFGMSKVQCYRRVIFPSVVRQAMPAYFNEIILMLHATSLVSTITIVDITGVARMLNSRYYAPFEAFISAGIIYLLLTILLVSIFTTLEKRINKQAYQLKIT